jgi:NADPH2:quinone reductase
MKAIQVQQFGAPDVMRLEEVPDPKAGPGQVLVRVKAAGVNPVDTYVRAGAYTMVKIALPYIPGSDAGGVVEAVGSEVKGLKPGDRVYTLGTAGGRHVGAYAELTTCEPWQVHRIPDEITFAQAAAVGVPYGTAYRALFQRAHALPGETVLVHGGSGGVGIAAVQMARAHGLNVIATAGTERGKQLVREQGAHHVLDHTTSDYLDPLTKLTDGRGVDVILEMLANVNLAKDLGVLAPRGRVVVIGSRGNIEISPRLTMARDSAILGMALWNSSREEMASMHAALVAGLEAGTLRPVVGREMPLKDAARAHEAVMAAGAYGKIVLMS